MAQTSPKSAASAIGANRPANITMGIADWIAVPDNPRQRDTAKRAKDADHLLTPSPDHRRVNLAVSTTDERRWKLDGHTRAYLWQHNMVAQPPDLNVAVYYVSSALEAEELYTHFDSRESVKTAGDNVFGAYRALNYTPQSKYLMMFGINSAVKIAQGLSEGTRSLPKNATVFRLIADWLAEIRRFDAINPDKNRFTANLLAAALVTFRKHPEDEAAFQFWTRFNDDAGEKVTLEDGSPAMDAVEALSRFMMSARGGMGTKRSVSAARYDVIGKALAAVETHRRGGLYTRGFAAIEPTRYLTE